MKRYLKSAARALALEKLRQHSVDFRTRAQELPHALQARVPMCRSSKTKVGTWEFPKKNGGPDIDPKYNKDTHKKDTQFVEAAR